MRIAVTHVTRLEFGAEVRESVMDARLGPRDDADQRVLRYALRMEPPGHVRRYEDGFGNAAHLLTNIRPHTFLQVSAESQVQTYMTDPFQLPERAPVPLDPFRMADGLDPSPMVPRLKVVEQMAAPFRPADASSTFEAVQRMAEMVNREFTYRQNVTDVGTSIEHIVEGRQGVCQDFAHLLLGLCRAIDIPARYTSGYIVARGQAQSQGGPGAWQSQSQSSGFTEHAPTRGSGASHAWVEAFTATHGWRGFDPTNNLVANEYYVKIAIGRDYQDVAPTRGTYHGGATERLTVGVTARALD